MAWLNLKGHKSQLPADDPNTQMPSTADNRQTVNKHLLEGTADSGQYTYDDYQDTAKNEGGQMWPMMPYNNLVRAHPNRGAPTSDRDYVPRQFRHYVNASGAQDVQAINGMAGKRLTGRRIGYAGTGYLYGVVPQIPGQTRDNVAGFHRKGPSPLNVQAMWESGPGSQPSNPGGPGKIAATHFFNPMTG